MASTAAGAGRIPSPQMMASPLTSSAAIIGGANAMGFGFSLATGSHYHLDLIGTGIFAVVALALRGPGELRQRLSAYAVAAWATKLAGFLFFRVFSTKHDARLDDVLSTTSGAFGFWFISFVWGWVVSLPHTVAAGVPVAARPRVGMWGTVASLSIFGAGFILETLADVQKYMFKQNPANRGRFCDVGVWQISQHPNYFGNLLVWTGILALNTPTLLATVGKPGLPALLKRCARFLCGSASPIFMIVLFYAQATGALSKTVELANAKYGADPNYQAYVRSTPLIVPSPVAMLRAAREGGSGSK